MSYFTSFRLATLLTKLIYRGECVSRHKSTFILLVMNEAYIKKAIVIDMVREHECLIFLFRFNERCVFYQIKPIFATHFCTFL